MPSDPHKVFSKIDYYIDFTNNFKESYHDLAKKLKVKPLFQDEYLNSLNRLSIARLLGQLNIKVPKYEVIRKSDNLELSLKNIWLKFQMPLVIKDIKHNFNEKSLLTYSFLEALNQTRKILNENDEVIIQEYVFGKYISTAVFPKYRDEDNYIPTSIEVSTFNILDNNLSSKSIQQKCLIDHNCEKRSLVFIEDDLKRDIQNITKEIQKAILSDQHSMLDLVLIQDKNKKTNTLKVLDIHLRPNLFEDSRFDFILKNSGVNMGDFILDRILKLKRSKFD